MATESARVRVTAKDFFLWLGAMVALYWSVITFILLIFQYIDFAFPNPLQYYAEPYSSGMPYDMASVLVMVPIYLVLAYIIRGDISRNKAKAELWVRRWAIILTLFVTGITMAADLIILLTTFFSGDAITVSFILKVLLVFLVAAAIFLHFIADLRGYFFTHVRQVRAIAIAMVVVALASILSGFVIVGTPHQARLYRYDDQKVSDLRSIQSQVVSYWQAKRTLPKSLAQISDSLTGYQAPTDPQSGQPYGYEVTASTTFQLCADFNSPTQSFSASSDANRYPLSPMSENWQHESGHTCFTRTIDPELYPPLSSGK